MLKYTIAVIEIADRTFAVGTSSYSSYSRERSDFRLRRRPRGCSGISYTSLYTSSVNLALQNAAKGVYPMGGWESNLPRF